MAILHTYYRPASIDEAVSLWSRLGASGALLAGGTRLVGELEMRARRGVDAVIDLAELALNRIDVQGDILRIGATATLAELAEHPVARTLAQGLLPKAVRGEGPVNLRNRATVGGLVAAAEADSEVYAALLALEAHITLVDPAGARHVALEALERIDGIITDITLPLRELRGAIARIARTPGDRPIVAAVAIAGRGVERVALCGVTARPVLQGVELDPPDDFKGSASYRRAMAPIVIERARTILQGV
ncbi:MAG: FAD binding domain-containing protein [Caldilineaceae bacterium]|nr:FAD binding domain-containing protein [Caldilineaceae bacterium]